MYIALKFFLLLILIFSFIFFYSIIGLFALIPFWIICGLIDVSRHKTMELKLIKEYFIGKGILTFLISPLNLFKQGRLPVEKLIDDKIGFDQLNEGFDKLDSGKVVRQILVP